MRDVNICEALSEAFNRELIRIPLVKIHPLQSVQQRCNLRAATLEFDMSAHPNIEYIAGNRLSIYPVNPADHVQVILRHLDDDLATSGSATQPPGTKRARTNETWSKFAGATSRNGDHETLRMALLHLYEITMPPSRDLLRIMAENCTNREQRDTMLNLCKTNETWDRWICSGLRTLKSTFEEFSSCTMSARTLLSELNPQQPRQYSLSSIKSSKRFRAEIIVFQHKFSSSQIAASLQLIKEREISDSDLGAAGLSPLMKPPASSPRGKTVHVGSRGVDSPERSRKSANSIRSLRSVSAFNPTPIAAQQVRNVQPYAGQLTSLYALSSFRTISGRSGPDRETSSMGSEQRGARTRSQTSLREGSTGSRERAAPAAKESSLGSSASLRQAARQYDGLCSNYLLDLKLGDFIVCEVVENPRFTLKGNRERPIMMIGQDLGVISYRCFLQQRALEHDRAQIFYTMFKDLSPKKFGDMQLVCITGHRARVEDLFRREIKVALTHKIISSALYIDKSHFDKFLDQATKTASNTSTTGSSANANANAAANKQQQWPTGSLEAKELLDLGRRIYKLLIESNGCLYTCCDPQMTQAIEILIIESVARFGQLPADNLAQLLAKWKGNKHISGRQPVEPIKGQAVSPQPSTTPLTINKFLFAFENQFEKSQIVQEIYDHSI